MNYNLIYDRGPNSGNGASAIPLIIANDQTLIAEGIQALLSRAGFRLVTLVKTANELLVAAHKYQESILIAGFDFLTSQWDGRNSFENLYPSARTIVTCSQEELANGVCCLPEKVGGIVSTGNSFAQLVDAINTIRQARQYIDSTLIEAWHTRCSQPRRIITPRQIEIIGLVADGNSSREIAQQLGLSRKTVDNHRTRIRQRMGVSSSAEMVNVAKVNGWI